jgi:hypothetical protein
LPSTSPPPPRPPFILPESAHSCAPFPSLLCESALPGLHGDTVIGHREPAMPALHGFSSRRWAGSARRAGVHGVSSAQKGEEGVTGEGRREEEGGREEGATRKTDDGEPGKIDCLMCVCVCARARERACTGADQVGLIG